jgi:hypothetical protein
MSGRELKTHGSHPEAPGKKVAKLEQASVMDDAPNWAKALMMKMSDVELKMDGMTHKVDEAVKIATDAKEQVEQLTKSTVTKEEVMGMISDAMKKGPLGTTHAKPPQQNVAAEMLKDTVPDKKREERARTLVFSNFPADTQEADIIRTITTFVTEALSDVEETFAFAKTGTKGAAKFHTADQMWKFLVDNKGKHDYKFDGQKIYMRAGGGTATEEQEQKEKAVRKVVRALIEREGGNGEAVKKRIDAKYRWGGVWWHKDDGMWEQVAKWSAEDRTMTLLGSAASLQDTVDKLLQ